MTTTRATQPSPDAAEAIVITPPAAQLKLSSRHPRREHTDWERMDRLNREAVANWRSRQHDPIHEQGRQSAVLHDRI